jgi:hypothetical protein
MDDKTMGAKPPSSAMQDDTIASLYGLEISSTSDRAKLMMSITDST